MIIVSEKGKIDNMSTSHGTTRREKQITDFLKSILGRTKLFCLSKNVHDIMDMTSKLNRPNFWATHLSVLASTFFALKQKQYKLYFLSLHFQIFHLIYLPT